jgi:hypothetical protein
LNKESRAENELPDKTEDNEIAPVQTKEPMSFPEPSHSDPGKRIHDFGIVWK